MGMGQALSWKIIGSVILAVLGVACQMVPYFCVAHIVTMMLSGEQNFFPLCDRWHYCIVRLLWEGAVVLSFYNDFPHSDLLHAA